MSSPAALFAEGIKPSKSLRDIGLQALDIVFAEQIQIEDHAIYLKGEFPTKIKSTLVPALVGVGKMFGEDDEATGFTTASVLNVLGEIYLHHQDLKMQPNISKIPEVFSLALPSFSRYEEAGSYNFYPPTTSKDGKLVRRPLDMTLFPLWHGFTNIPNDSDSTSAMLMSQALSQKIRGEEAEVSQSALEQISEYRDIRRHPMFYNRLEKRKETGAFMTWLFDEHDPKMPRFFFSKSSKGSRIPFNKNDVDCVVNANILKLLAILNKEIPGKKEACDMLNSMIEKDESYSCGIYYPNTYNLPFALSSAKSFGDQCLTEKNEELMLSRIVEQQLPDGSWKNLGNIWTDETLSTAFALHTLLNSAEPETKTRQAILDGLRYLLTVARVKSGKYVWKEDNFFTATAIARSLIMWRSKAYTHAVIASVFLKASEAFPDLTDIDVAHGRF